MNIDYGFACQDDCLDKMVPSDLRKLVAERDVLQNEREALKAELDAAMREASELVMVIWRAEFQQVSPNFELCNSLVGVISQIDHMYAAIRSQRDAALQEATKAKAMLEGFRSALEIGIENKLTCAELKKAIQLAGAKEGA